MRSRGLVGPLAEALALGILALGLAVAGNRLRPDPLPARLPEAFYQLASPARAVLLPGAARLHGTGRAVFLDARLPDEFLQGHVLGAFSLPVDRWQDRLVDLEDWIQGEPIVVYAGAGQISWADDLAGALASRGHEDSLFVLVAPFEEWRAAGHPTEEGEDPLGAIEAQGEEQEGEDPWGEESETPGEAPGASGEETSP